jgi:hypothetical protein
MCSPVAAATSIATSTTIYLHAQGTFAKRGKGRKHLKFEDVSDDSTTVWSFSGLIQATPGVYIAPSSDECACVRATAASGKLSSQTVEITVGHPMPACTPTFCP